MATKKLLLPVLGAVAIAGGGAAYYVLHNASVQGPEAIARYLPDETAVAVSLSFDDKAWTQLDKFGTPEARQLLKDQLQKMQTELTAKEGISFEQDIKPWIGEVMLGVLPVEAAKPGAQPEMVMAVTIKDKPKALSFQKKLQEKFKPEELDYKGVKIAKMAKAAGANPTYSALIQDVVLVGSSQAAIEAAIDTTKGAPSLASLPNAKEILSNHLKVENAVARVYVLDSKNLANLAGVKRADLLKNLQGLQSGSAVLGVDAQGIRMRSQFKLDPNSPQPMVKYPETPGKIASYFPSQTFALTSGNNLTEIWKQTLVRLEASDPQVKEGITSMRSQFKSAVGLDLEQDVVGWMNGEFALGLMPESNPFGGIGGALLVQTSNRTAADKAIAQLDAFARKSGIPVSAGPSAARPVATRPPAGAPALSHGWVDDTTLYLTITPASTAAIAQKPTDALHNNSTFKRVTSTLPQHNVGYFYLNMAETLKVIEPFGGMPKDTLTMLNSVEGVGMTSTPVQNSVGEAELLLALKPAK